MRWQASWMLQNSEPETFAAECACKRDKQMTIQVLLKASSFIKQERSECSVDRCCDWCDSLPAFLVHPSEIWVFRQQITTPATHHCKLWLLLVSWSMDKIPAVHPFFLIHGHIGLESMMCKVLSRQRVFMKQLLGHRVTLRSSPRQDDQNLNLVNSCVGPAETALVFLNLHSNRTIFSASDLVAYEASIYCICKQKHRYYKVQHRQLTLGQFVLLPMQGWKWPVLEMLGIPGTCLSRHWITAMNVCDSRFDRLWHGAKSSHSFF